ncbi:xanthine dehydrogenase small subunit [Aestuariispira insulae]|uniref:Xanthine dehydrogenase small subunit n=1 Tax=Aestuariispira insulae TaxID=1461337 RepID=A0A3D9HWS0_9PROT|nr:xanthine dehydrogenase small subunit [Aestuariispira insulae]RED53859.1 xanthine dehydrogenase small subunit [Aestuariispira insulae]
MSEGIRFVFRGEVREIDKIDPTLSVLRWLREVEGASGTKEGCAEGDCGACTVVLGELVDGSMQYRAVNACIQFMPTLHGKQLITVEDLASPDGALHPVQKAMVETSGSQCGFCTPGFVMSMFAMKVSEGRPSRDRINDVLAGNLCRCTGYGPIIEASEKMYDAGPETAFLEEEKRVVALLEGLSSDAMVETADKGRRYFAPARVDDLARVYTDNPDAVIVAGATDVGLWVTKMHKDLGTVIYLGRVKELKEMRVASGYLEIGAGVSYTDAWDEIKKHYPDFGELIRRIGSTQVRNAGTIGGNVANGSPIGDTPPALIAAGARLVLRKGEERREIDLESFFIDYGKQDRGIGEFVEMVKLPLPKAGSKFRSYKISKRFDQDISAACGAFMADIEKGQVKDIRICFGGMAGTPARAKHTEAALIGKTWDEETVKTAMAEMVKDYNPLTDMRASEAYRAKVARNLLYKFFVETSQVGEKVNTRVVGDRELAHV